MTNIKAFQAVLAALSIALLSFASVQASAESLISVKSQPEKVNVQPIPSAEDCSEKYDNFNKFTNEDEFGDDSIVERLWHYSGYYAYRYSYTASSHKKDTYFPIESWGYTTKQFYKDMNELIPASQPELINCRHIRQSNYNSSLKGLTLVHLIVDRPFYITNGYVESLKWALSKGYDVKIPFPENSYHSGKTPLEVAKISFDSFKKTLIDNTSIGTGTHPPSRDTLTRDEAIIAYKTIIALLSGQPFPATKYCDEVDGQTPPANEYCIIAENVQLSRRIAITGVEKLYAGGNNYKYEAHRDLSGTGLFPGWKAEITFTCSSKAKSGCGYADYALPSNFTPEDVKIWKPFFEARWGLNVHCGQSADLLDLDRDLEAGESVSVTHASDTERSSPMYMDCRANALDPFTLTVKTIRLAK